jgi:hypothetical protein
MERRRGQGGAEVEILRNKQGKLLAIALPTWDPFTRQVVRQVHKLDNCVHATIEAPTLNKRNTKPAIKHGKVITQDAGAALRCFALTWKSAHSRQHRVLPQGALLSAKRVLSMMHVVR